MNPEPKIRLGVGLPETSSHFHSQFVDSFFCIHRPVNTVYLRPLSCGPIDAVRNELVDLALLEGCTHLWMCDTDQVYPQDALTRLLAHDLPIVAAKVHRRGPPYDPILLRGVRDHFKPVPEAEWAKGGLVEVDATGCGSVLVKIEVFKRLTRPWFRFELNGDGKKDVGEDVGFYIAARQAGYRIFVDCDCKVGHLATFTITEESYWAYRNNREEVEKRCR